MTVEQLLDAGLGARLPDYGGEELLPGLRVLAADLADPSLCSVSPSFSVTSDFRLLLAESTASLKTEAGAAIRL